MLVISIYFIYTEGSSYLFFCVPPSPFFFSMLMKVWQCVVFSLFFPCRKFCLSAPNLISHPRNVHGASSIFISWIIGLPKCFDRVCPHFICSSFFCLRTQLLLQYGGKAYRIGRRACAHDGMTTNDWGNPWMLSLSLDISWWVWFRFP